MATVSATPAATAEAAEAPALSPACAARRKPVRSEIAELELELDLRAWTAVRAQAARAAPNEAAGFLLGMRAGARTHVRCSLRARCSAASPHAFELEPLELVRAQARAQRLGLELIGLWHSHPSGSAAFSDADRAGAQAGWSHLVWAPRAPAGDALRSWRAELAREGALELREERVRLGVRPSAAPRAAGVRRP